MDSPVRKVDDELNFFLFNSNYNYELLGFCEDTNWTNMSLDLHIPVTAAQNKK